MIEHSAVLCKIDGHVKITDDNGNILLDKHNAIHAENMSAIFARALAHQNNSYIYRIAYGNGGSQTATNGVITYNPPNDGQGADAAATWQSRLYHETYSEIVDATSILLGTDPGSADANTGTRPGGGAVPSQDPTSQLWQSGPGIVTTTDIGLTAQVVVTSVLNASEPAGQLLSDNSVSNAGEAYFSFDEIGLYSYGEAAINTAGYQQINVGDHVSTDSSGLAVSTDYYFQITVDGSSNTQIITFKTPAAGTGTNNDITFGDICEAFNTGNVAWSFVNSITGTVTTGTPVINGLASPGMAITDYSGVYPSLIGTNTYGYLVLTSASSGSTSLITIDANASQYTNATITYNQTITTFPSYQSLEPVVVGTNAGVRYAPTTSSTERERLLSHITFSPIMKSSSQTRTITYTFTISFIRSAF